MATVRCIRDLNEKGLDATRKTGDGEEFATTQMAVGERELIEAQRQAKTDRLQDGKTQKPVGSRILDEELQQLRALATSTKVRLAGAETAHDSLVDILSEHGVDLQDYGAMSLILSSSLPTRSAEPDDADEQIRFVYDCSPVEFIGYSVMMADLDQAKQDYFDAAAYVVMATIAPTGSSLSEDCYDRAVSALIGAVDSVNHIYEAAVPDDDDCNEFEKLLAAKSTVLLYIITGYEVEVLRQRLARYDQRAAELEKVINNPQ